MSDNGIENPDSFSASTVASSYLTSTSLAGVIESGSTKKACNAGKARAGERQQHGRNCRDCFVKQFYLTGNKLRGGVNRD